MVERVAGGGRPARLCLELVRPERCPDRDLLEALVTAHRRRGALIALDDLAGGSRSLSYLEALKPDFAKLDVEGDLGHRDLGRRAAASWPRSWSARTRATRSSSRRAWSGSASSRR